MSQKYVIDPKLKAEFKDVLAAEQEIAQEIEYLLSSHSCLPAAKMFSDMVYETRKNPDCDYIDTNATYVQDINRLLLAMAAIERYYDQKPLKSVMLTTI